MRSPALGGVSWRRERSGVCRSTGSGETAGPRRDEWSMSTGRLVRLMTLVCPLVSCAAAGREASTRTRESPIEATATARACAAPTDSLGPAASVDGWTGEYSLSLVGRPSAGGVRSVRGDLVLHEQPASLRYFRRSGGDPLPGVVIPLFGTADVDVETVGAVRVGDLSSADPAAPGVLVIEGGADGRPSILLRFGSEANRRDRVRYDGGFMVLEVREIRENGFSGTWTSGVQGVRTRGHFCAERRAPGRAGRE